MFLSYILASALVHSTFYFYFPIFDRWMHRKIKIKTINNLKCLITLQEDLILLRQNCVFEVYLVFYCNYSYESRMDVEGDAVKSRN